MEKEVKPNEKKRPGGARRVWLAFLLGGVLVAAAFYAVRLWQQQALSRQVEAALPARPDIAAHPPILRERLEKAETKARSAGSALDGVEELGRLYHANGFTAEAEACWRLLHDRQPRQPRWCYYLADLRRAESDDAGMAELLRKTLELAPDYSAAHLHLANLQLKTGDFDGAERDYRLRLALEPRDPYARLGLARLALQRKRTDEARTLLEELLKDAPNFSSAHNLLAEILAAAGDVDRTTRHRWLGVETFRYAEPADPWVDELQAWCYDYDRLCVLGSIESMRENREGARALYERAIGLYPEALDAYLLLSVLHFKQEQPLQARDLLEQARSRVTVANPTALLVHLSRAYRLLHQPAEAERVAREGLAQVGDSAELLETLGLALADAKRHEEAVKAYRAALGRNPNDANLNYNLAVSLLSLGRLDDVLEALDRSLTLQPTFPPTMVLRGRIEMAAGHWAKAEEYLRPVFESHPENAEARTLFAQWHQHQGEQAEARNEPALAEQHYRDGLTVDPASAPLHVRLGIFYVSRGRFADAVAPLETYRRLMPDNAHGCLLLGRAYAALDRRDDAREVLAKGVLLGDASGNSKIADFCREALRRMR
jgi:HemY protein